MSKGLGMGEGLLVYRNMPLELSSTLGLVTTGILNFPISNPGWQGITSVPSRTIFHDQRNLSYVMNA